MNALRTLAAEARWRGLWGTVRAIKMHRLGAKPYFVGEDEAGNRFFNNPALPAGRDRWVEYAEAKNYDAVKIAPEWYVGRGVGDVVSCVVFGVVAATPALGAVCLPRVGVGVCRLVVRVWGGPVGGLVVRIFCLGRAPRWPPPRLGPSVGYQRRCGAPRRFVVAAC